MGIGYEKWVSPFADHTVFPAAANDRVVELFNAACVPSDDSALN
jgi:hypothetical protein